jgi:type I restriction enzyme S subunit
MDSVGLRPERLFRITSALDKEFARSRIDAGDLLLSIQGTVGRVAIAPPELAGANISRTIARLSFAAAGDSRFYKHWFLSSDGLRAIDGAIVGTTRSSLNIGVLRKVPVPSPTGPEKSTIADILDTLDTTIRQTEAIIEKLKQVKQGLLHDLLTRGIDTSGELRPPQSQAPHLYKDSPLGWIPREWNAFGLADMATSDRAVLRTGPFGSSLKGEHLTASGRPVVTIGSLGVGRFLKEELLYVSEATARLLADFELIPGDIAFSRVADVGRSVVVRETERGWIMSSNFMRISVESSRIAPEYLQAALAFDWRVKKQVRSTVNSAGRDVASSAILMSLRFAVPTFDEQRQFNLRMFGMNQRIALEESLLTKMQAERTGLMDDLLTGRVRVTPLLA